MRLGRLPHDPVAVAAAPKHKFGLVPAKPSINRQAVSLTPGLYSNDKIPCCTAVAMVNAARGVAALNGYGLVVDPDLVPAFYGACIGAAPGADLAATHGAEMLAVINFQSGYGLYIGPQALVGLSGTIQPQDRNGLALAMERLGHVYAGVSLYERDMELRAVWDIVPGRDDGAQVGGHALNLWDYSGLEDTATVRVGTWGAWQLATWAWIEARIDEAYALAWRQLIRADGTFYSGVNSDGLVAELPVA